MTKRKKRKTDLGKSCEVEIDYCSPSSMGSFNLLIEGLKIVRDLLSKLPTNLVDHLRRLPQVSKERFCQVSWGPKDVEGPFYETRKGLLLARQIIYKVKWVPYNVEEEREEKREILHPTVKGCERIFNVFEA